MKMKKAWSNLFDAAALVYYKLWKFVYVSIYFYFLPALTIVFVFRFGDLKLESDDDPCDD
jgi:hypothetical protein